MPQIRFSKNTMLRQKQFSLYAVLAQSPNYTPASADYIMDIFREYIEEI